MACTDSVKPTVSHWTHISAEAFFVKLWGIVDPDKLTLVRDTIKKHSLELKKRPERIPSVEELPIGKVVLALHENRFQRAKIMAQSKSPKKVYVRLIDIGLYVSVLTKRIRIVDNILSTIPYNGLAEDFILDGVVTRRHWTKNESILVNSYLKYLTEITLINVIAEKKIIQVSIVMPSQSKMNLSDFLIANGYGDKMTDNGDFASIPRSMITPSNESNVQVSHTGSFPIPMEVLNSSAASDYSDFPTPMTIPTSSAASVCSDDSSFLSMLFEYQEMRISKQIQNSPSIHSIRTFVYSSLPINSTHQVVISHIIDGVNSFAVQLKEPNSVTWHNSIKKVVDNIQLVPVTGQIGPGMLCLGRSAEDKSLRRAVVSNVTVGLVSLYFVDYGSTEFVPFKEIYNIPPELLEIPALAYRFALANVTNNDAFKTVAALKIFAWLARQKNLAFKLKVVEPSFPTLQYCELFIEADGKTNNIQDFILPVEYKSIAFREGQVVDVFVLMLSSPLRFFVQLELNQEILDVISKYVEDYCKNSVIKDALCQKTIVKNMAVCVPYEDGKYHRGLVVDNPDSQGNVTVFYVDYGNSDTIHCSKLRFMNNDMISQFPLQAIECSLDIDLLLAARKEVCDKFFALIDEGHFKIHVKSVLHKNVVLVDLINENGLNIANHLVEIFGA